ncbi:MAG: protocatechuate 3,4-dioxygenase [Nitrosomonas sp.]|nr:protocatechuate 3,4-dioxygenase [Nitrosomonas sp.]MBP6075735.1 protocatechuate 3,4-dioxygenase [Nitrosomonas sp.]
MKTFSRRRMVKLSMLGSIASVLGFSSSFGKVLAIMPTPSETEGPFYPVNDQRDKDADLTQVDGHMGIAQGQHIIVSGQVTDITGNSIANALLDIWQANANGRYRHPRGPNTAKLDENFQGWAMIRSDSNGLFRFKTVVPGAYPASSTWIRPPHIHFKISKPGYRALTTQMYFPDEALNKTDLLLNDKSATERAAMIAGKIDQQGNLPIYEYNIVLDLLRK